MNLKIDYNSLIDERLGLITDLREIPLDPRFPKKVVTWNSAISNGMVLNGMPSDRIAGGTNFNSKQARLAAIGESVERYVGNYIKKDLLRGSFNELTRKGYYLLDPLQIPLYSKYQYSQKGFPFIPLTRDLSIEWIEGYSLTQKRHVFLPASLIYINYYSGERLLNEPPTNFVMYAGIACGDSLEASIKSGLYELIERDATAIWWSSAPNIDALDIYSNTKIKHLLQSETNNNDMVYKVLPLTTDIDVPVTGALLHDKLDNIKVMGFSARHNPEECILKSISETIQLHSVAANILNPNSFAWKASDEGILNDQALKPFKNNRAYQKSFKNNFRDMVDLLHNVQYYLDPTTHHHLDFITSAQESNQEFFSKNKAQTLNEMVRSLDLLGLECFYVDLTTPDIKDSGLSVTRTFVPGLVPNGPTAFPYLAPDRLYNIPKKLGWKENILTEGELNLSPLPHS